MSAAPGLGRSFLARLFASAFLFDGAFYIVLTAIPLKAVQLDASALQLGLLPVLSSGVYVVSALSFGRLSDRVSPHRMAMLGACLRVFVVLALVRTDSLTTIYLCMPGLGIANGLFWPGVQGGLGRVVDAGGLSGAVGWFNMAWSSGKMWGFALGGLLSDAGGFALPLWVSAAATLAVLPLIPGQLAGRRPREVAPMPLGEMEAPGSSPSIAARRGVGTGTVPELAQSARRTWRTVGWLANSVLFGVGATLNFQYPKFMDAQGMSGTDFGIFLGLVYLVQTATFAVLGRWRGWHHRLRYLLGSQGVALACLGGLLLAGTRWEVWALAPGIGVALGVSYAASLYYSLLGESGTGRSSGYHEAVLGSGTLLLPVGAGLAVQATGRLEAAYPLLAVVVLGLIALEIGLIGRGRAVARSPAG